MLLNDPYSAVVINSKADFIEYAEGHNAKSKEGIYFKFKDDGKMYKLTVVEVDKKKK